MKLLSLISEETSRGEMIVAFSDWVTNKFEGENEDDVQPIIALGTKLLKAGFNFEEIADLQSEGFNLVSEKYAMEVTVMVSDEGKIGIRATDGNDLFVWGPVGAPKLADFQVDEFLNAVGEVFTGLNTADHTFEYGSRKNVTQNF